MDGVAKVILTFVIAIMLFSSSTIALFPKAAFAQYSESITVRTDKSDYSYGNTITIYGTVSSVIPNQDITITLSPAGGKSVVIGSNLPNSDGSFSLTSGVVSSQNFPTGSYTVSVSYEEFQTQTTFTVSSTSTQPASNLQIQTPNTVPQSANGTIPAWIKNNAKWWSEGTLGDGDFLQGIQYLMQQRIIVISTAQTSSNSGQDIPSWVKTTAKWWAEGQVGDSDFVKAMQYLVENGIINVNNNGGSNNISSNSTNNQPQVNFDDLENKCEKRYGPIMYYDAAQRKCMPIGGSNGIVAQPQYQESDNMGMVHFKIGGQTVSFRFYNETSGSPISGLAVAFALDKPTQSVGVIVAVDPDNNYPPQLIFLSGKAPTTIPTSWKSSLIPQAYATESSSDESTVYQVATSARTKVAENLFTPWIPYKDLVKVKGIEGPDILGLLGNAVTLLGTNNAKLKALAHGNNVEVLSYDQAQTKFVADYAGKLIGSALFLGGAAVLVASAPVTVLPAAAASAMISGLGTAFATSLIYDTVTLGTNSIRAINCDPNQKVVIGTFAHFAEVVACQTPKSSNPTASVSISNNNNVPEHVDLISKTNLGYETSCELTPNTSTSCPAQAYDYLASISAPGYVPVDEDISVPQGQAPTVDATLKPLPNNIQLTLRDITCQSDSICYSQLVTSITGGTAPYSYQLDTPEMSIDGSGYLHWQSGGGGQIPVHVCAVDANGMEGCGDASITVTQPTQSSASSSGSSSGTSGIVGEYVGTWQGSNTFHGRTFSGGGCAIVFIDTANAAGQEEGSGQYYVQAGFTTTGGDLLALNSPNSIFDHVQISGNSFSATSSQNDMGVTGTDTISANISGGSITGTLSQDNDIGSAQYQFSATLTQTAQLGC